jgi:hypothetical protein
MDGNNGICKHPSTSSTAGLPVKKSNEYSGPPVYRLLSTINKYHSFVRSLDQTTPLSPIVDMVSVGYLFAGRGRGAARFAFDRVVSNGARIFTSPLLIHTHIWTARSQ